VVHLEEEAGIWNIVTIRWNFILRKHWADVWPDTISLIPPLCIEVHVLSQESESSCILNVSGTSMLPLFIWFWNCCDSVFYLNSLQFSSFKIIYWHVEQKLFTLSDHLSSGPLFSGVGFARSLVFCVIVICLSLSFDHCIVCPSFFWPLYCLSVFLLTIVLSVRLQFTAVSGYPFDIFKLFLQTSYSLRGTLQPLRVVLSYPILPAPSQYYDNGPWH